MPRSRPRVPRLFLAGAPVTSSRTSASRLGTGRPRPEERVELAPGEEAHARKVLRLRTGDPLIGLDGAGRAWVLELLEEGARVVEPLGRAPEPGTEGAPLPWIEVAVAWPRRSRGEPMLGALCQLGVACVTPLRVRHPGAEPLPDETPERWHRILREACKQSERAWLPEVERPHGVEELLEEREGAALALLDARDGMSLDTWVRSLQPALGGIGSRERPIVLLVGPEGGFDGDERRACLEAGATRIRLAPHVLRIETAAVAALAVCVAGLQDTRAPEPFGEPGG